MAETVHPPSLSPPGLSALVSPGTEFLLTEIEHCSQTHSTEDHESDAPYPPPRVAS